jgi:hypothetical protein
MDMTKHPDKYFSSEHVPEDYVFVEPSRMTGASTKSLILHWLSRIDAGDEAFRFKDQSPKTPFRRNRKSSQPSKLINLDSTDDESKREPKRPTTVQSLSTTENEHEPENDPDPTPKPKKTRPKKSEPKKSEPIVHSSADDSDDQLPMLKIGPPRRSAPKQPLPKTKKAPKVIPVVETHPPITEDEPLLQDVGNEPIALTGPVLNSGSMSTRFRFLRSLSTIKAYQQLV